VRSRCSTASCPGRRGPGWTFAFHQSGPFQRPADSESAGYLLLRRAPTGELQDVTDQYVAKVKRDIDSIDGAIEFVMAQQGPRHL
jgi:hypothetical protein